MRRLTPIAVGLLIAVALACRSTPGASSEDRDRDGLDDHLEAALASRFLPALHEFGGVDGRDACPWPTPRPILYRARPRVFAGRADLESVAITYVLLYAADCGALGHTGDNEAFTVFVHRDPGGQWRAVGATAIAHQGTPNERRSLGDGRAIWISQDKHSPYATFAACVADDWFVDACTRDGAPPPATTLFNVGEPSAPMSDDVGDAAIAGGANPSLAQGLAPGLTGAADAAGEARLLEMIARPHLRATDQTNLAYLLFHGQSIWRHETFLGAGDITAQLFHGAITLAIPAEQRWDAEDSTVRPVVVR